MRRLGKTIPQRGTDDSKISRLSCPGQRDKEVLSIQGTKQTKICGGEKHYIYHK